jgi:tetratricopeptide (TPR) repeat protein
MLIRRLLNVLRALSLLLSVAVVCTYVFWADMEPHLRSLDGHLAWLHRRGPLARLEGAQQRLADGDRDKAIRELVALAEDLEDVRFGHRRGHARMKTLRALAEHHESVGDPAGALRWIDELLEYDPRDIVARQLRVGLLRGLGRHEEALAQLEEDYRVGSSSGLVQLNYFQALADAGRAERLAEALLALGAFSPLKARLHDWEFRVTDGDSFEGEGRQPFSLAKRASEPVFRAKFWLNGAPRTVAMARVDLPDYCLMRVESMRCTFVTEGGARLSATLADLETCFHMSGEIEGGQALEARGEVDPYFVFVPEQGPAPDVNIVELELGLSGALPDQIARAALPALSGAARQRLEERFGARAVEELEVELVH